MDTGLSGKVALVAAASKGLGYAIAEAFAAEGAALAICALRFSLGRSNHADDVGTAVTRIADAVRAVRASQGAPA